MARVTKIFNLVIRKIPVRRETCRGDLQVAYEWKAKAFRYIGPYLALAAN